MHACIIHLHHACMHHAPAPCMNASCTGTMHACIMHHHAQASGIRQRGECQVRRFSLSFPPVLLLAWVPCCSQPWFPAYSSQLSFSLQKSASNRFECVLQDPDLEPLCLEGTHFFSAEAQRSDLRCAQPAAIQSISSHEGDCKILCFSQEGYNDRKCSRLLQDSAAVLLWLPPASCQQLLWPPARTRPAHRPTQAPWA